MLLLNKGDPNIRCFNNKNVLQTAIENNSSECVQILREHMREQFLKVFNQNQQQQQEAETDLDLTSVSSLNLNEYDLESYSFVKTSTFDEIKLAESLDQPPPVPPRTHANHKLKKEHVYVNLDNNNNSNNKTPTKSTSDRFHSPERLPLFYYKILEEKLKEQQQNETKLVDQETQTNSKCFTIKKSDFVKSPNKTPNKQDISPEDIVQFYNKQQPEHDDNQFPAFNIFNRVKTWVSKLSPLIGGSTSSINGEDRIQQRQSRSRLHESRHSTSILKSLSPEISNSKSPKLVNKRASSLANNRVHQSREVSFLNQFITDEIGSTFFSNVLGNSNKSTNQQTPKHDSTKDKTNLTDTKVSRSDLIKLRFEDQLNSSIFTTDKTLQEIDSNKTLTSSTTSANDLNDLVKSFENLNVTKTLTEPNMKAPVILNNNYSNELYEQIENKLNTTSSSEMIMTNMFSCFQLNPNQIEWREGNIKSAFNYLLLDPRITQNLPSRAKYLDKKQVFRVFVASIFYIGKGTRARPYAHLQDAIRLWKSESAPPSVQSPTNLPKKSKKIERIINIWKDNYGVVSLHCFQNVIPSEAYTREAAMIDAIGIHNLTNVKKGNYYGEAKEWSMKHKCQLGTLLLRNACEIFLAEGERQLNPIDIKI